MFTKSKKYNDTLTLTKRCLLLSKRNPDTFLTSILLPALMMLLFVSLFGNLIHVENTSYVNYIVPAILIQCIAQGASVTAIMMNKDVAGGIAARFTTLPIKKYSILSAHVLEAFIRNMLSSAVVLLIAVLLGFRPSMNLGDLCIVFILTAGTILVFSWLAIAVGIGAGSAEGASAISAFAVILPYLSSGFVPVEALPRLLEIFAQYQPMTPIINTMRSALLGSGVDIKTFAAALCWCAGLTAFFYVLSLINFKKGLHEGKNS